MPIKKGQNAYAARKKPRRERTVKVPVRRVKKTAGFHHTVHTVGFAENVVLFSFCFPIDSPEHDLFILCGPTKPPCKVWVGERVIELVEENPSITKVVVGPFTRGDKLCVTTMNGTALECQVTLVPKDTNA